MYRIVLFILFPTILSMAYIYLCYKRLPFEYDGKMIRRIYYLLVLIYLTGLSFSFSEEISSIKILRVENNIINFGLVLLVLFCLFFIWEYIFVSCKTFKSIKIKDVEVSMDEVGVIKYVDKLQEKEIKCLYSIIDAKINMTQFIDSYIMTNELNPSVSYKDIITEYQNKRGNIKVYVYNETSEGLNTIQQKHELNNHDFSSILYVLNHAGYYISREVSKKNHIYVRIRTKYLDYDIIVVLESDFLIDNEYLILIDLVHYFENKVELEIMKETCS